jgi:hypothetical protein
MPIIQSVELQGVLQSKALRVRQKRQSLSEKEKAQAKTEKGQRLMRSGGEPPRLISHPTPLIVQQTIPPPDDW